MAGYCEFASYYDILTANVDYHKRAEYFHTLIKTYESSGNLLLDLACGTGSLSVELAKLGYDVIGVDGSSEMLSQAMSKSAELEQQILYLCQDMPQLDLYGTVDVAVCALDSLNHLTDPADLQKTMERVSLFLNPGGLFLFDVNTPYKQQQILGNNTFVYDCDEVFCVWQNMLQPEDMTQIQLDFFIQQGSNYRRESECFTERAYSRETLEHLVCQVGLQVLDVLADDSFQHPVDTSQRWIFVCRKS